MEPVCVHNGDSQTRPYLIHYLSLNQSHFACTFPPPNSQGQKERKEKPNGFHRKHWSYDKEFHVKTFFFLELLWIWEFLNGQCFSFALFFKLNFIHCYRSQPKDKDKDSFHHSGYQSFVSYFSLEQKSCQNAFSFNGSTQLKPFQKPLGIFINPIIMA